MTQFNESFYTDDFDQEMLDFVKENFKISDYNKWNLEDENLRYYTGLDSFWTGICDNWGTKLTKQEFKEKIGITEKKQERVFKLIDRDGYIKHYHMNSEYLSEYGIYVEGETYFQGTMTDNCLKKAGYIIIGSTLNGSNEFQYFKEVDSIPLPKDKPPLEYYFVKPEDTFQQNNTFTKSMLVSGEHVVELEDGERYLVAGDYLIGERGFNSLHSFKNSLKHKEDYYDITKVYSGKSGKGYICAGGGISPYLYSDGLTLIWQRESPEKQKQREVVQTLEEDLKRAQKALEEAKSKLEEM